MKILVFGATGGLLLAQLLHCGHDVIAIVPSSVDWLANKETQR